MQITEKTRSEIALAIGRLAIQEAEKIAVKVNCSMDTIYREWKKMRTAGSSLKSENEIVVALAELAAIRQTEKSNLANRFNKSIKKLSAKPKKQPA